VVKGLDVFQNHFARYADQYVLIGGTAATLAMEEAGLEFRATKDLDIVLHIEALNAEFATAFWAFVEQGEYEIRHASKTGKPVLYRFQKPKNERFPAMLELFCRTPDGMVLAAGSQLRLSQMLAPDSRIKVAAKIAEDLDRFLGSLITDGSYDPKSVGVNVNLAELVGRIRRAYRISSDES